VSAAGRRLLAALVAAGALPALAAGAARDGAASGTCQVWGEVSLSAKLVCPLEPVEVTIRVRASCPDGASGVRSLRVKDPLPDGLMPYDGVAQVDGGAPTPEWIFDFTPAQGITVTHWVLPTRPGRYVLGERATVELTQEDGGLTTGHLASATLTVVAGCAPARGRTLYLPYASQPACLPLRDPADLVLLVDRSSSMGAGGVGRGGGAAMARQLESFLDALVPARDRVALVAFDQRADLLAPLGSDRRTIAAALGRLALAPGTRLERAIEAGLAELAGPRALAGRRRVLILVTDGVQTGPGGGAPVVAAAAAARARGVAILSVALGTAPDRALLEAASGDPSRTFGAATPGELDAAFREAGEVAGCVR